MITGRNVGKKDKQMKLTITLDTETSDWLGELHTKYRKKKNISMNDFALHVIKHSLKRQAKSINKMVNEPSEEERRITNMLYMTEQLAE